MADKNVMVLVDDKHGRTLDSVADAIRENGLKVDRVMRGMKTIIGAVSDEATIERIRRIEGVASIREERTFSLPPMNPSIPQ